MSSSGEIETMIINTRADLEVLRGTPAWPVALQLLAGATIRWRNTAAETTQHARLGRGAAPYASDRFPAGWKGLSAALG